ncbi:MAG: hypothetical protein QOE25_1575 [Actinomycetota bacterium]|jgi:hypothetical protein|nr:hypothetical protein [Actinomycetota bacterium]
MERKVLLRVTGDGDGAKRTLREIAAELLKLGAKEAIAKVSVDTGAAKAKLAELKGDLKGLSADARVDLKIAGAETQLADLQARLERLSAVESSPKVDVRIGQTIAQVDRVEARLASLNAEKASPKIEIDGGAEALAKVAEIEAALKIASGRKNTIRVQAKIETSLGEVTRLRREIEHTLAGGVGARPLGGLISDAGKAGRALEKLGEEGVTVGGRIAAGLVDAGSSAGKFASQIGGSIGSAVISGLTGIAAALVIVTGLLAIAGPFVLALVGALFALVAVLASAAAGIGVVAIALAAAFGPVGALIAYVAFQITKVTEAQQKQKQATAALKTAVDAQHQAQARLAQAQANASRQRLAALQAEKDATNALAGAQIALQDAKLGVEGSQLALLHAQADLKAFKDAQGSSGNSLVGKFKDVATSKLPGVLDGVIRKGGPEAKAALDYKDKLFAVKEALQGVKDAEQGVKDAQFNRSKAQATVNAFQTKGLRAFDGYASALDQVKAATQGLTKANGALTEADKAHDAALKSLTPAESKFAESLSKLKGIISDAFGPAADEVFAGLTDALGSVASLVEDPGVQTGLREIGRALGDMLRTLAAPLRTEGAKRDLRELIQGGVELTRDLTPVLKDLLRLLVHIGLEALPDVKKGAKGLASSFHGFVEAELHGGRLARQIRFVLSALGSIGRLAKAALGVLIALFPEASKAGQSLVGWLTKMLDKWRKFLSTKEGQAEIVQFFRDSVTAVKQLFHAMDTVRGVLSTISDIFSGIGKVFNFIVGLVKKLPPGILAAMVGGGAGQAAGGGGVGGVLDGVTNAIPGVKALKKLFGFSFGAEGGIATGPVIAGEAGHEALIPLRQDVFAKLGAMIAAAIPTPSFGSRGFQMPAGAARGSSTRTTNNEIHVHTIPGKTPDLTHAMAVIAQRLNAIGA